MCGDCCLLLRQMDSMLFREGPVFAYSKKVLECSLLKKDNFDIVLRCP